jgi:hypothetical protein
MNTPKESAQDTIGASSSQQLSFSVKHFRIKSWWVWSGEPARQVELAQLAIWRRPEASVDAKYSHPAAVRFVPTQSTTRRKLVECIEAICPRREQIFTSPCAKAQAPCCKVYRVSDPRRLSLIIHWRTPTYWWCIRDDRVNERQQQAPGCIQRVRPLRCSPAVWPSLLLLT